MDSITAHDPVAIANEFIKISKENLTLMQLLKFAYIAHGFKLGITGHPLSSELVEAWKYGPVLPRIYHTFKRQPPERIQSLGTDNEGKVIQSHLRDEENKIIQFVYDTYGGLHGWELSALTHAKGTPWEKCYQSGVFNIVIPNEKIKEHFKEHVINKLNDAPE